MTSETRVPSSGDIENAKDILLRAGMAGPVNNPLPVVKSLPPMKLLSIKTNAVNGKDKTGVQLCKAKHFETDQFGVLRLFDHEGVSMIFSVGSWISCEQLGDAVPEAK